MKRSILLNGASGTGKTTSAVHLKETIPEWGHIHPDGIWDTPNMSPAEIFDKAIKLAVESPERTIVIDCQIPPSLIKPIVGDLQINWHVILLDCPETTIRQRLVERGWSSDDDFSQVIGWQKLLRQESEEAGCLIIDSHMNSTLAVCDRIIERYGQGT